MARYPDFWCRLTPVSLALLPFSGLFWLLSSLRRAAYRAGLLRVRRFPVPVLVVGNISVGGTGKTPLVIWLVEHLKSLGLRPGVVARGYGGRASHWPQQVRPDSDPVMVGDEPVLIASRTQRPVCVAPDRPAAVQALLDHTDCNVVVSDDGLQHYALGRDLEIVVIDPQRRFGNGLLLPAGPLREGRGRLKRVDFRLTQGIGSRGEYRFELGHAMLQPVSGEGETRPLSDLRGQQVHAVAGIGEPKRFFDLLRRAGLEVIEHPFADHHPFRSQDLDFNDDLPVLMTEKDAVKCRPYARPDLWALRVEAVPDQVFIDRLDKRLQEITHG